MRTPWDNVSDNIQNDIKNKPLIAICIPYKSKWELEFVEKVYIPLKYKPVDWCDKTTFLAGRVASISVARHMLVKSALNAKADYLFFVDIDNIFEYPSQEPNECLKILYQAINKDQNSNSKEAKIVSGLYRVKQKTGFNWSMWMRHNNERGKYIPISQWTGNWINVSVIGLGCCLIDTQVFKDVPKPYFRWEEDDEPSEDFYFIEKCKENGYSTYVYTDIRLSHLGDSLKVKSDGTVTTTDM